MLALTLALAAAAAARDCSDLSARLRAQTRERRRWDALALARECADDAGLAPDPRALALSAAAELEARLGDARGALQDLDGALALRPDDSELFYRKALVLRDLERPQDALTLAARAAGAAVPARERARAERLAAELELDLGAPAEARRGFERALALAPEDLDSLIAMANALRERPPEAEPFARRASEAAARAPYWCRAAALRASASAWRALGKAPPAAPRADGESAVAAELEALRLRAVDALDGRRPGEAAARVEALLDAAPAAALWQQAPAYRLGGCLWARLGEAARARQSFASALELDTRDMGTLAAIAELARLDPAKTRAASAIKLAVCSQPKQGSVTETP